jgi:hypothetical protein
VAVEESRERVGRQRVKQVLRFFCENILNLRWRMRFEEGFVEALLRKSMENLEVRADMRTKGVCGLKEIMHYSGISLYEMLMVVQGERVFASVRDKVVVAKAQVEWAWKKAMDGMSWQEDGPRDVWGNTGEDMMSNALLLSTTLMFCRSA